MGYIVFDVNYIDSVKDWDLVNRFVAPFRFDKMFLDG